MNKQQENLTRDQFLIRLVSLLMAIVCLGALCFYTYRMESVPALSKEGSRGEEVRQIQTVLKDMGYYYDGSVDGVYGTQTRNAVTSYQRDHGFNPDGIAGPATLKALGIQTDSTNTNGQYSDSDITLLANLISAEARGESFEGQVAVGAVILNRVEHPSFPDTIAGVAYQPGAFTAITDGQILEKVAESAKKAARTALNGSDPSGGALYYYNPDKTSNKWIRSRPIIKRIGRHLFCK